MPTATKVKLTDAFVAKATLPSGKADHIFWDSDVTGFGLRVRTTSKTYLIMYRPVGAGRSAAAEKFKIASANTLGATAARQIAKAKLGEVAAGKNPAAERAEEKRRKRSVVGDLLDRYEAYLISRKYVDLEGTMSTLRRNLLRLRGRDVKTIAGSEIVDIRNKLTAEGLEGAADNFFSRCRAFFSWCMSVERVIDSHPTYAHRKEKRTRADKLEQEEYGRALSDEELVKVWFAALPKPPYDDPAAFGDYIRFLILTGCRRTEGSKVRRSMLIAGQSGQLLVIPKQITKSGRDHNVPVTPQISAIFGRRSRGNDIFFPSWKTGREMQGWAKMLVKLVEASGVDFDLHDLRRTFRTGLSGLHVDSDVAEICINHGRKGLEAVYNRNTAGTEMRDAFQAWSTHVEKLVRAQNAKLMARRPGLTRKQGRAEEPPTLASSLSALKRLAQRQHEVDELDEGRPDL